MLPPGMLGSPGQSLLPLSNMLHVSYVTVRDLSFCMCAGSMHRWFFVQSCAKIKEL